MLLSVTLTTDHAGWKCLFQSHCLHKLNKHFWWILDLFIHWIESFDNVACYSVHIVGLNHLIMLPVTVCLVGWHLKCCVRVWDAITYQFSNFNDATIIRWICGIKVRDEALSASPQQKPSIVDTTAVLRKRRLRLYRHVRRVMLCIKSLTYLTDPGTTGPRRPKKTWSECLKIDISNRGLVGVDAYDRNGWKSGVRQSLLLPTA